MLAFKFKKKTVLYFILINLNFFMHTLENFAQNALDYKKVSWISSQYIVIINETLTPEL